MISGFLPVRVENSRKSYICRMLKLIERQAARCLRHPSRATIRLFQTVPLELLGVLNDNSSEVGRRHVAVIYRAWLTNWDQVKRLQKGNSSIKGLGWIDLTKDRVDLSEFEYWSQLCLRKFYPSTPFTKSGFRVLTNAKLLGDRVIVVTGRIGSGKTETATYLSQKFKWPLINSGHPARPNGSAAN